MSLEPTLTLLPSPEPALALPLGTDLAFTNLAQLAASVFQLSYAWICVRNYDQLALKAIHGLEQIELTFSLSLCQNTLNTGQLHVFYDAHRQLDADSSLLKIAPPLLFYASAPLRKPCGQVIGSLVVCDAQVPLWDATKKQQLLLLASQAEHLLLFEHHYTEFLQLQQSYLHVASSASAAVPHAAKGVMQLSAQGHIQYLNDYVLHLLGYTQQELEGQSLTQLLYDVTATSRPLDLNTDLTALAIGRTLELRHKKGSSIPVQIKSYPLHAFGDQPHAFMLVVNDLREVLTQQEHQRQERNLLHVLHRGLTDYKALLSGNKLWSFLKEALKQLTHSEYALIGEVVHQPDGTTALKVHAISSLPDSPQSQALMQQLRQDNMLLHSDDNLLGCVFRQGQVVIHNEMNATTNQHALPMGHAVLSRYLGVPIYDNGQVIGMYAIANSPRPYDQDLVQWLEPFTSTCALLINLYRQFTEQQRIHEELRQAKEIAEQASQAKSDFLSVMSHELRTPLNAVLGFAQLLSNGRSTLTERQQRQVTQITGNGQHLLSLINELLDLAQIEAGHTQVRMEAVPLEHVLNEALEAIQVSTEAQKIRVYVHMDCAPEPYVRADALRLKQILLNLLSNAVKYNKPHGSITLRCTQHKDRLRISIKDTGIGIERRYFKDIFEPFNRLSLKQTQVEGAGVGLALTHKLIQLLRSEIHVESTVGQGSEFWFELPLWQDASAPSDFMASTVPTQPVLLIDSDADAPHTLDLLQGELPDVAFHYANSAAMGFELACSQPFALILLNIDLRDMEGFQFYRLLQQNALTAHLPITLLLSHADPILLARAQKAESNGFFVKPYPMLNLCAHIQRILQTETES
ncbi:hypothetical protein PAEH1_03915 [Paenalcaligenes hominis]|uniref:histidine kinase n=1 Tax=Paenalcaligenes hominis TaxID=643674 RepID=A0A1U9JYY3_9BURK|nr:ATP-binding protein [Paenalcaligenes hominis]AQS50929.1 hypothetical protein PAEH1_03915 [Paenalcaligenes hominis]